MNKNILCGALINLFCTQVQAIETPDNSVTLKKTVHQSSSIHKKQPNNNTARNKSVSNQKAVLARQADKTRQLLTAEQQLKTNSINCDYRISAETKKIDRDLVLSWAEYAVTHSFDFNLASLDTQLKKLQSCYTKNGWKSFTQALDESGNFKTIKSQNLTVRSMLDGETQLIEAQNNQWKISLPIKVIYKNDQEEVTHFLNIYLTIGWRNAFNLGISQMIATPRLAPMSQKAISIKEAIQSISFGVTNSSKNSIEQTKKIVTPFLASLFVNTPRSSAIEEDSFLKRPELTLKKQRNDVTRQIKHLAEQQKNQGLPNEPVKDTRVVEVRLAQLVPDASKVPVAYSREEPSIIINGTKNQFNQFVTLNPDFFDSGIPKLLSDITEKGWSGVAHAVQELEKIKTQKFSVSRQRDSQPQLIEIQDNQWKLTLPMQVVYHQDKRQVTQLINVNVTLGKKISGELGIIKMRTISGEDPLAAKTARSSSAKDGTVTNQMNQRADSAQSVAPINKIQLAQASDLQSSQYPSITWNNTSESPQKEALINCEYKVPSSLANIDPELILKWAEQAAIQSFDFNSVSIDAQLEKLQSCYTEKGWSDFKTALDKSGNVEAIKTQKLIMSSKVRGQTHLVETKTNQWKVELPLEIVYQNNKDKVTQLINVNLTLGRKLTGEFGIMQIIATPDKDSANSKTAISPSASSLAQNNAITPQDEPTQKIQKSDSLRETQKIAAEQGKQNGNIDCNYQIPAQTKIDQAIVLSWANHAVTQSFNLNSETIDAQLQKLQSCFTEKGWGEFTNALEKSGNIKAFKTQKISASSKMDGETQIIESKDDQWLLTLPLKVDYQFSNGNATQLLNIYLTVGRKNSGELGIINLSSTLRVASTPSVVKPN